MRKKVDIKCITLVVKCLKLLCESNVHVIVCLHRYDDYNYGEVNQLLERSLKVYVKTVACHPEKTTARMYFSFWRQFRHSEKVQDVRFLVYDSSVFIF